MRPFWEPEATGFEKAMLAQVIDSNYWNDGPITRELERRLAKVIGVEHVVCTSSGTAALFLALTASGVNHRSVVSVPDVTFIATANAASLTGASVILGRTNRATDAVAVHVSGHRAPICDVTFVEDSCEAFPMAPETRAACYSFSPNKIITTGQGGAVATNDAALARDMRAIKDQGRLGTASGGDDDHQMLGFNFKMSDLQASVGIAQLADLDRRIDRRREMQAMYAAALPVLPFKDDEIPLWTDMDHPDREAIIGRVEAAGFSCRRFWKPLSQQPPYRDPSLKTDTSRLFWLPSSFQMTDDDVRRVIAAVGG